MNLDPNPGDRYQPRDEASVYIAGHLIREQPEHSPEVLAKAQCIPPGVAARRNVKPAFNTAIDDSIAIRLAEIRAQRRIERQEARRMQLERAERFVRVKRPRVAREPAAGSCMARVMAVLAAAEHPLLLADLRAAIPEYSGGTVQDRLKDAKDRGAIQSRLLIVPGKPGRPAEYWPASRPWPDLAGYRDGAVVVKK